MSDDPHSIEAAEEPGEHAALKVLGWFSVGMAVAALSMYVGYQVRSRYKFNRRTPYDFYANAGEQPTSEFGVGV
ncbi:MAG TPA: hypothetical protein VE291_06920 [Terracidiphilus sp.]|jgi:hypothetical protein|nr:hypothetical protein [Terracidiphilus sp.]